MFVAGGVRAGGVGGRMEVGRPIEVEAGHLSGNYRSVCLSVCVSKEEQCRFLGLCVVPRRAQASGSLGRDAVGLTDTIGTREVVRLRGKMCNFGRRRRGGSVVLVSCVGCLTSGSVRGASEGISVCALVCRLRRCSGVNVELERMSGGCVLNFIRCLGATARGRYGDIGGVDTGARIRCCGIFRRYLGDTMVSRVVASGPVSGVGGRRGPGQEEARQTFLAVSRLGVLSRASFRGTALGGTFLFDYFYKLERDSVITLA